MPTTIRDTIIQADAIIRGSVRYGRRVDVLGYVEGDIAAETLVIAESGRVFGRARADVARVDGELQGEVTVKSLLEISRTGRVNGHVLYGSMVLEPGGDLSADVRNIRPELTGDFQIDVVRGRAALVTVRDLAAIDPDDEAHALVFSVSGVSNGWVASVNAVETPLQIFRQSDLEAGHIVFQHDGSDALRASFDVTVRDAAGATSGTPRTVEIIVSGGP